RQVPRFRANENRQLYNIARARQRGEYKQETTIRFRKQFEALESISVRNIQDFINTYNLSPSLATGEGIGGVGHQNIVNIAYKTIELIQNMRETVKIQEYDRSDINSSGKNLYYKVGGEYLAIKGVDSYKLESLELEYQNIYNNFVRDQIDIESEEP